MEEEIEGEPTYTRASTVWNSRHGLHQSRGDTYQAFDD